MPEADGRLALSREMPLHERVFQLKDAIRKAGFAAHGRTRVDKDGRIVMGVIVPVAFPTDDPTVDRVRFALRVRVMELCGTMTLPPDSSRVGLYESKEVQFAPAKPRPSDMRTSAGRRWKQDHAGAMT